MAAWQTHTCQGLSQSHHVGHDSKVFPGPQLAGAAKATLHLIKDQQSSCLVTQVPEALQKFLVGGVDAPLPL